MNDAALLRAQLSLEGLSIGDSFGERFFGNPVLVESLIAARKMAPAPWRWTDDTAQALAVVECLRRNGGIQQDALARLLADGYECDRMRGYGGSAHTILEAIALGISWQVAARSVFDGGGSMGNGAAMRVAPIGAYFCGDYDAVVEHARRSAEPTHAHPDGQAGAIAVALAAAFAARVGKGETRPSAGALFELVVAATPDGATRDGLRSAASLSISSDPRSVAMTLGSGGNVISSDTVPFSIWCAARHLTDFTEAMWSTVSGLGDRDTTCAIVGGIVALAVGAADIPSDFTRSREPLSWPIPPGRYKLP